LKAVISNIRCVLRTSTAIVFVNLDLNRSLCTWLASVKTNII